METITINLYDITELSEKAAERALEKLRYSYDPAWNNESRQSIEAFCNHFGVKLLDWEVGAWQSIYYRTDATNKNFRGIKLKDINPDYSPTGYCLDLALWGTFRESFKESGDALHAFNDALDAGFKEWRADIEYQFSDEHLTEYALCNEFKFTEDGNLYY